MNDLSKRATRKPDLPEEIQVRWQRILDLMGRVVGVPAGLIMRVDSPQVEVFLSSVTEGNPCQKGERADLNTGYYCETVMKQRALLLIPDALKDPEWDHNPNIKLGMTFYLRIPPDLACRPNLRHDLRPQWRAAKVIGLGMEINSKITGKPPKITKEAVRFLTRKGRFITERFKVFQIWQQDWSSMERLYCNNQKEDGHEDDRDLESEFETNPLV